MVNKLSELFGIFRDQIPDFSKNRTDGDDIIGDAYESRVSGVYCDLSCHIQLVTILNKDGRPW